MQDNSLQGGNIPDSLIAEQIAVLNADFAPIGLTFELVETKRVVNPRWFNTRPGDFVERQYKSTLSHVNDPAALKIYSITSSSVAWAYVPFGGAPASDIDGVSYTIGGLPNFPGTDSVGHLLTHEVGHWAGLQHTFEGGCNTNPNQGDGIADTPPHLQITNIGCDRPTYSCRLSQPDPTDNYMNYVKDGCRKRFTPGQIERMRERLALRGLTLGGPKHNVANPKGSDQRTTDNSTPRRPTVFQRPTRPNSPPRRPVVYQRPTRPNTWSRPPVYQRPTRPNSSYRRPVVYQRPTRPTNSYRRPNTYQRPTWQNPSYRRPNTYQRPTWQNPSYRRPTVYQRPTRPNSYYRPNSYQRPTNPSYRRPTVYQRPNQWNSSPRRPTTYQRPTDSYRRPQTPNGSGSGGDVKSQFNGMLSDVQNKLAQIMAVLGA
ncbi:hypothetical protein HGRIS_000318 [Hohenbuehelia grisea]